MADESPQLDLCANFATQKRHVPFRKFEIRKQWPAGVTRFRISRRRRICLFILFSERIRSFPDVRNAILTTAISLEGSRAWIIHLSVHCGRRSGSICAKEMLIKKIHSYMRNRMIKNALTTRPVACQNIDGSVLEGKTIFYVLTYKTIYGSYAPLINL